MFLVFRKPRKASRLHGPYRLRYLHLFVDAGAAGAFILSRNGRSADWVGLSAHDLAETLGNHRSRSDYQYFWFSYTRTAAAATDLAQYWYHRYRPTDNTGPPGGHVRTPWRCTVAGCTACALAGQQE